MESLPFSQDIPILGGYYVAAKHELTFATALRCRVVEMGDLGDLSVLLPSKAFLQ